MMEALSFRNGFWWKIWPGDEDGPGEAYGPFDNPIDAQQHNWYVGPREKNYHAVEDHARFAALMASFK